VNIVTARFNTVIGQMTEMSQGLKRCELFAYAKSLIKLHLCRLVFT